MFDKKNVIDNPVLFSRKSQQSPNEDSHFLPEKQAKLLATLFRLGVPGLSS